jgi:hypothetical protein
MTPVHIGELTTEVVPDTGAGGTTAPAVVSGTEHDEQERMRELQERTICDAARTHAEGFDD